MIALTAPRGANKPFGAPELTVTVSNSFDGSGIARDEWDQFVKDIGGDIYVTYDWCRIWWRHYGENRRLRLFILRKGRHLVGVAPMFIERVRLGPVSLKIAKRVGADFALTIFALPLALDYAEAAYAELITRLIESKECDVIWFGFMPGNDPTLGGLRDACRSLQEIVTIARDASAGPHIIFRLPDSFEDYLAALDKRRRQNYRRDTNLLARNFSVESDIVSSPQHAPEAFEKFRLEHERQWQAEGKLGHFGDWPRSELFNAELANEMSRLGRFRIVRLFADGRIVASQYAFVFGDCCFWRLPARVAENEFARFGLGRLGLIQLIKAMIAEGVHRIEAGLGHYEYKLQLGGQELECRSVLVATNRRGVASRVRIFLKLSDLLHLVYCRIWFARLAPRLRMLRQPFWRSWIRSRL